MSELPISSSYRSRPQEPVSEDERNRVAARLNSAFTDGSLDSDVYRSRLDRLFAATTLGELVPVVDGLPPASTYDEPQIVSQPSTPPGELTPARSGNRAAMIAVASVSVAVVLIVVLLLVVLL